MNEFEKLGLSKNLVESLEKAGILVPTEIQRETIPLILAGKDVIGNAATGSGKTLAFASGIIEKIHPGHGVQSLIMTPTRELAEQISKVIRTFDNSRLNVLEVFGGVPIERQLRQIGRADVIVGTPGRLLDHLKRRSLDLDKIKILVLDEADRMVDMGFLPDVERILDRCQKERQTLLFSATTSPDIKYIRNHYMKEPTHVAVKQYVDASKLKQVYYNVEHHQKFSLLMHLLKEERAGIVMVFCNTRRNVDLIAMNLERYGIDAQAIHGGLEQKKRSRIITSLHENQANILVCTDVAARGLDIKNVTHVYNYDIPKTAEEYVHRVGRTARAGKEGMAINLLSNRDYEEFQRILDNKSLNIEEAELPNFEDLAPRFNQEGGRRNFRGGRGFSRGGHRGGHRGRSGGFRGSRGGGHRGGFHRNKRRY